MTLLLFAVGMGLLWHGLQVVWVAPVPSQLRKGTGDEGQGRSDLEDPADEKKRQARRFQIFWLDQYAWIGIILVAMGLVILLWSLLVG